MRPVLQGAGGQRRDLKSLRLDRTGKNQTGLCRIDEPEGPVVIRSAHDDANSVSGRACLAEAGAHQGPADSLALQDRLDGERPQQPRRPTADHDRPIAN